MAPFFGTLIKKHSKSDPNLENYPHTGKEPPMVPFFNPSSRKNPD